MTDKPLFVLLLNLATAWAQTSTGSCLDPGGAGTANKADCCAGSGNGQADVGGVLFEYTCNSYANNYGPSPRSAGNAFTCANLCRQDATCHASSWKPNPTGFGGDCWFSSAGFNLTPDPYQEWVILVNTERAGHVVNPDPTPPTEYDCDKEVETAKEECASEKEQLSQNHDKHCQDKLNIEIDKCENDKTLLEQSLRAECDEKIAALNPVPPPETNPPPPDINPGSGTCALEGLSRKVEAGDIVTVDDSRFLVIIGRRFTYGVSPWKHISVVPRPHAKTIEETARECIKNKCDVFFNGPRNADGTWAGEYYQATRPVTNADFPVVATKLTCTFLRF